MRMVFFDERVHMMQQKPQPPFRIKGNPIECPYWDCEGEDWSCSWCSGEGDVRICTWKPADEDFYGLEDDGNEKAPCSFWADRLEDSTYIIPLKASITDSSDRAIGELSGWMLNPSMIIFDEDDSYYVMDGVSELLINAHQLIIAQKYLFSRTGQLEIIPFITRLSFYDEYHSLELEEKILDLLLQYYGVMIYSLGFTELDDDDFFEYQDDEWELYWEERLWELGWLRDEHLWYAFDHEQRLLDPDPILFDKE